MTDRNNPTGAPKHTEPKDVTNNLETTEARLKAAMARLGAILKKPNKPTTPREGINDDDSQAAPNSLTGTIRKGLRDAARAAIARTVPTDDKSKADNDHAKDGLISKVTYLINTIGEFNIPSGDPLDPLELATMKKPSSGCFNDNGTTELRKRYPNLQIQPEQKQVGNLAKFLDEYTRRSFGTSSLATTREKNLRGLVRFCGALILCSAENATAIDLNTVALRLGTGNSIQSLSAIGLAQTLEYMARDIKHEFGSQFFSAIPTDNKFALFGFSEEKKAHTPTREEKKLSLPIGRFDALSFDALFSRYKEVFADKEHDKIIEIITDMCTNPPPFGYMNNRSATQRISFLTPSALSENIRTISNPDNQNLINFLTHCILICISRGDKVIDIPVLSQVTGVPSSQFLPHITNIIDAVNKISTLVQLTCAVQSQKFHFALLANSVSR